MRRRDFLQGGGALAVAAAGGLVTARPVEAAPAHAGITRNYVPGMQYRPMGATGVMVSALSFGMMRPPMLDGEVDEDTFRDMVRMAIDHGVNYIDTSHVYSGGKSQTVTGRILGDGYRQRVHLASKMPWWQLQRADDFERILDLQLEQLQTDHLDFYLLHAITAKGWAGPIREHNVIRKIEKARERGKIKHMGFSFHASLSVFREVLRATPEWEFCQLQLNYVDAEYEAGLTGLKYAHDRGMGVIAMEPLRGGFLADMPPGVKAVFAQAHKKRSDVQWAMDYLWSMPEVSTVLSGMSAVEHVRDNLEYARRSTANVLDAGERRILARAVQHLWEDYGAVPCVGCEVCHAACPEGVAVAQLFVPWNQYKWNGKLEPAANRIRYVHGSTYGNGIQACTDCGKCVPACPQRIDIPAAFGEIRKTMGI